MPLYLLQVEEVVGNFRNLGQKRRLFCIWLLCFEVDSVHCFAELQKGLVFDPAGVVCQAALQEVETSYQFIGLCLLNLLQEVREQFNADAAHAPDTVRSKGHIGAQHLVEEFLVIYVLRYCEKTW